MRRLRNNEKAWWLLPTSSSNYCDGSGLTTKLFGTFNEVLAKLQANPDSVAYRSECGCVHYLYLPGIEALGLDGEEIRLTRKERDAFWAIAKPHKEKLEKERTKEALLHSERYRQELKKQGLDPDKIALEL